MPHSVFLTGASGFVGRAILDHLLATGTPVTAALRKNARAFHVNVPIFRFESFGVGQNWQSALSGCDVVVHSAARVHVMNDAEADPLMAFRKVNVEGTLELARQAAKAGVRRFIFISSVKVNGEGATKGRPYKADDLPAPSDPYGVSKMEAEQGLRALAGSTSMEVVIIRPVLIYGPGVKANFLSMMRWLDWGVPLPFGAIDNRRSLVALDNLVDLVVICMDHPSAGNQTFLVSDGEDLSTTELLQRMARALRKPARLFPVPSWALQSVAIILGRKSLARRLFGSLQVDIEKTRSVLGWVPKVSVDDALSATAQDYQGRSKK